MKGREIIEYTVRGEMPDLEQVRNKCYLQTQKHFHVRKIAIIAATVAVLLGVSITVYAALRKFHERADAGLKAGWETTDISNMNRAEFISIEEFSEDSARFDIETANKINSQLSNKIFNENGDEINLIIPLSEIPGAVITSNEFCYARRPGNVYDEKGFLIYSLSWMLDYEEVLITLTEENMPKTVTHEQAAEFLGTEFKLPVFPGLLSNDELYIMDKGNRGIECVTTSWGGGDDNEWLSSIWLSIEKTREAGTDPYSYYSVTSLIEEIDISGTTVYRMEDLSLSDKGLAAYIYAWTKDGVSYELVITVYKDFETSGFTNADYEQIIREIVE